MQTKATFNGKPFQYIVSSVLNSDHSIFGKKHLFDGNEESAWNSEHGSPQWINVKFQQKETIQGFVIQFQGGFAGKECHIKCADDDGNMIVWEKFTPEDTNKLQTFNLNNPIHSNKLKFVFDSSTDFFGRIIIYQLQFL